MTHRKKIIRILEIIEESVSAFGSSKIDKECADNLCDALLEEEGLTDEKLFQLILNEIQSSKEDEVNFDKVADLVIPKYTKIIREKFLSETRYSW